MSVTQFKTLQRKIPTWFQAVWLWLVILCWGAFSAPGWAGQFFAKAREVKHFALLSPQEQQAAIYGSEMALLQMKVVDYTQEESDVLLVVPEKPRQYAIGNNPPLLRAVTQGSFEVASITQVASDEAGIVFWHPEQAIHTTEVPAQVERVSLEKEKVVE